jgi:hypothetical protein
LLHLHEDPVEGHDLARFHCGPSALVVDAAGERFGARRRDGEHQGKEQPTHLAILIEEG